MMNKQVALASIALVTVIGLSVYMSFFAPCKYLTWMPTKDVPARCLVR